MFPARPRGTDSDPTWPRNFPGAKRTRTRRTCRETISEYSSKAGSPGAKAQPFFAMRGSEMEFQRANTREAAVGPMHIGNPQSPILRKGPQRVCPTGH